MNRVKYAVWLDTGIWRCSNCGEGNRSTKLLCWNCDTPREQTDEAALHENHSYFATEEGIVGDFEDLWISPEFWVGER